MFGCWAHLWAQYEKSMRPGKLIRCEKVLLGKIGSVGRAVGTAQVEKWTVQWSLEFVEVAVIYFGKKEKSFIEK